MLNEAVNYLTELLATNEFFQGGFVLAMLGSLAVWGRRIPATVWSGIKRLLLVECDVQDTDKVFKPLLAWLADQPYSKRVKRFSASLREEKDGQDAVVLTPAPGNHLIWFKNRLIFINRSREKMKIEDLFAGFHESFSLKTFGSGRNIIEELLQEVMETRKQKNQGRTRVHLQGDGWWNELCSLPNRPLESVVLEGETRGLVVEDMERFLRVEDRYISLGVPYRRGYLFHGSPGTGKTSFCLALAAHFGLDVSILSLSDEKLNDTSLAQILSVTPKRSILLLEDIDCLYEKDRTAKTAKGLTLSGLLNALDGAQAQVGRVVIMTTNHIEALDNALIRPGRADLSVEFRLASLAQIEEMHKRFFPDGSSQTRRAFAEAIGHEKCSTAEIQGMLIKSIESSSDGLI